MKRFLVVIPASGGGVEVFPMKAWLRNNPEFIPPGLDPSESTSHQIKRGLRRKGWIIQESADEVRLVRPAAGVDVNQVDQVLGDVEEKQDLEDVEDEQSFALESQLRDFLAQNISTLLIGGERLKVFVDAAGNEGVEFQTDVGRIDILAAADNGAFYVFELKRAKTADKAVGQLARYMGWVTQKLAKGTAVHGVVVAREISQELKYAASVIPNVSLLDAVKFELKEAGSLPGEPMKLAPRPM